MEKLKFILKYIRYYFKSTNEQSVHSPFLYELLKQAVYVKEDYYAYNVVEKIRVELLDSDKTISYIDYGASSTGNTPITKSISSIVKKSAKSPKYAQLLFRLVNYIQPRNVLELGTSLGISTSYMALANKATPVVTIEASKEIAAVAAENFKKIKAENITQVVGTFDDVLPSVVEKNDQLDFVFFDGNHQKAATLNYFEMCINKAHENSIFIFDDINWSQGMSEAWEEIKSNKHVTVTVDLFFMGLVFFKKGQAKQHFIIRF